MIQQTQQQAPLPKVTVVTISFNAEKFIRKTLESVIAQDYPNLEYLVIDGGSKDSTPAIIREYAEAPESRITWWVSEKDSGVSEAFNKGITRHTGDFIGYMNAGDYFASPDALSRLFAALSTKPNADIVFGKARLTFEHHPEKIVGSPAILSHKLPTAHQAIYYHRRVWEQFGTFSMDYRYAMDYEHYHRLKNRIEWAFSDVIVAERPLTSARNSFGNPSRTYREYLKADLQHKNPAIVLNYAKFLRDKIKEKLR
ncbi:MAG: glycosyltransferase [Candidatus Kapabacteria bacterium]|jgi:glycosyltransferase involved in cell wall biosynthesis|nr:glycosyltransferase [Candidatus Kapabacteria bacterium]